MERLHEACKMDRVAGLSLGWQLEKGLATWRRVALRVHRHIARRPPDGSQSFPTIIRGATLRTRRRVVSRLILTLSRLRRARRTARRPAHHHRRRARTEMSNAPFAGMSEGAEDEAEEE